MGEHNCYQGDVQDCIKKKAYELWEKNGRQQGRDVEYWVIAEKTVKPRTKTNTPKAGYKGESERKNT